MINGGIQSPAPANVRARPRGPIDSSNSQETREVLSGTGGGEPAAALKTTLHFEKSDADSHIFSRMAGLVRGHGISRARTKEDVYRLLLVARHCQIVINCATSGREGFELLEGLREISQLEHVPIVVLSDRQDEATIRLAFALGATRYFVKPLLLEEYKQCIAGILSEAQVLDKEIARFEKFSHSESRMDEQRVRPPKASRSFSLLTEKQPLTRYPWVHHSSYP